MTKYLIGIAIFSVVMFLVSIRLYTKYQPNRERKVNLERQAVWLARYIKSNDCDIIKAANEINNDKGILIDCAIWKSSRDVPFALKRTDILVYSTERLDNSYIVITNSLAVSWVKEDDLFIADHVSVSPEKSSNLNPKDYKDTQ